MKILSVHNWEEGLGGTYQSGRRRRPPHFVGEIHKFSFAFAKNRQQRMDENYISTHPQSKPHLVSCK